jgi:DNA-directed RNA polymerase beta' subunit
MLSSSKPCKNSVTHPIRMECTTDTLRVTRSTPHGCENSFNSYRGKKSSIFAGTTFERFDTFRDPEKFQEVKLITLRLASPDTIRRWAETRLPNGKVVGLVHNANTLHHNTLKPLKGGLFCERIFGPTKDFQCACGIQKEKNFSRTTATRLFCLKCDVEYTWSLKRRYQSGYIRLVSPVAHLWYVKETPSFIAVMLDMKRKTLDSIIYCSSTLTIDSSINQLKNNFMASQPSSNWKEIESTVKNTEPHLFLKKQKESVSTNKVSEDQHFRLHKILSSKSLSSVGNQVALLLCHNQSNNYSNLNSFLNWTNLWTIAYKTAKKQIKMEYLSNLAVSFFLQNSRFSKNLLLSLKPLRQKNFLLALYAQKTSKLFKNSPKFSYGFKPLAFTESSNMSYLRKLPKQKSKNFSKTLKNLKKITKTKSPTAKALFLSDLASFSPAIPFSVLTTEKKRDKFDRFIFKNNRLYLSLTTFPVFLHMIMYLFQKCENTWKMDNSFSSLVRKKNILLYSLILKLKYTINYWSIFKNFLFFQSILIKNNSSLKYASKFGNIKKQKSVSLGWVFSRERKEVQKRDKASSVYLNHRFTPEGQSKYKYLKNGSVESGRNSERFRLMGKRRDFIQRQSWIEIVPISIMGKRRDIVPPFNFVPPFLSPNYVQFFLISDQKKEARLNIFKRESHKSSAFPQRLQSFWLNEYQFLYGNKLLLVEKGLLMLKYFTKISNFHPHVLSHKELRYSKSLDLPEMEGFIEIGNISIPLFFDLKSISVLSRPRLDKSNRDKYNLREPRSSLFLSEAISVPSRPRLDKSNRDKYNLREPRSLTGFFSEATSVRQSPLFLSFAQKKAETKKAEPTGQSPFGWLKHSSLGYPQGNRGHQNPFIEIGTISIPEGHSPSFLSPFFLASLKKSPQSPLFFSEAKKKGQKTNLIRLFFDKKLASVKPSYIRLIKNQLKKSVFNRDFYFSLCVKIFQQLHVYKTNENKLKISEKNIFLDSISEYLILFVAKLNNSLVQILLENKFSSVRSLSNTITKITSFNKTCYSRFFGGPVFENERKGGKEGQSPFFFPFIEIVPISIPLFFDLKSKKTGQSPFGWLKHSSLGYPQGNRGRQNPSFFNQLELSQEKTGEPRLGAPMGLFGWISTKLTKENLPGLEIMELSNSRSDLCSENFSLETASFPFQFGLFQKLIRFQKLTTNLTLLNTLLLKNHFIFLKRVKILYTENSVFSSNLNDTKQVNLSPSLPPYFDKLIHVKFMEKNYLGLIQIVLQQNRNDFARIKERKGGTLVPSFSHYRNRNDFVFFLASLKKKDNVQFFLISNQKKEARLNKLKREPHFFLSSLKKRELSVIKTKICSNMKYLKKSGKYSLLKRAFLVKKQLALNFVNKFWKKYPGFLESVFSSLLSYPDPNLLVPPTTSKTVKNSTRLYNNIYVLSNRYSWDLDEDLQTFLHYLNEPTSPTDFCIPTYEDRVLKYNFFKDPPPVLGGGLIQKLLAEFHPNECSKILMVLEKSLKTVNILLKSCDDFLEARTLRLKRNYILRRLKYIRSGSYKFTDDFLRFSLEKEGSSPVGSVFSRPRLDKSNRGKEGHSPSFLSPFFLWEKFEATKSLRTSSLKKSPRSLTEIDQKSKKRGWMKHSLNPNQTSTQKFLNTSTQSNKAFKLKNLRSFLKESRPEWMVLSLLPVLPPDLRPILQIGNQVAASDLNRLYQKVIYRNERLKRFLKDSTSTNSPQIKFAYRLLQEAVDNLIDNGKGKGTPETDNRGLPLKSLTELLKGKKGRFRQNLLGKRVDYSGRSVIVVGPRLRLHECGLPKEMAIELFLPFLIQKIFQSGKAATILGAKLLLKTDPTQTWEFLTMVMRENPVLLNRAPTLHRFGFQAFQPRLVEGKAILLHPLVCPAFNADFDGDQMAVHVPITAEAKVEAWKLMLARNHLLSSSTGEGMLLPSQDMVLGCYYLTATNPKLYQKRNFLKQYNYIFTSIEEVLQAYESQKINLHSFIWLRWNGKFQTNVNNEKLLELQVNTKGQIAKIFKNYVIYTDSSKFVQSIFVKTTPGRVLFYNYIFN